VPLHDVFQDVDKAAPKLEDKQEVVEKYMASKIENAYQDDVLATKRCPWLWCRTQTGYRLCGIFGDNSVNTNVDDGLCECCQCCGNVWKGDEDDYNWEEEAAKKN